MRSHISSASIEQISPLSSMIQRASHTSKPPSQVRKRSASTSFPSRLSRHVPRASMHSSTPNLSNAAFTTMGSGGRFRAEENFFNHRVKFKRDFLYRQIERLQCIQHRGFSLPARRESRE